MADYIIFENWPDIEAYKNKVKHPYDEMSLMDIYGDYLRMKNENPRVSDEELSSRIGRSPGYFYQLKRRVREASCKKRLLQSV